MILSAKLITRMASSPQSGIALVGSATPVSRRKALQGICAATVSMCLPGCGSSPTTPPPQASNPQPVPSGPITTASLSVSATASGSIGVAFAGLSYEKHSLNIPRFTASNTDLIGLFRRLGPSILRIGGNSVDQNVWTPNGAGQTLGQIAPSDVNALAGFLKGAGWQCLYGVNLGGSASGATTPALAAAEVAYAAQQLGSSLLGIEIGNEPDLYGDSGSYYAGNWSLSQFLTLWGNFRSAIVTAVPTVAITGPADATHVSSWTIPFGQTVGKSETMLLTQHYYRANGQSPSATPQYLITQDTNLVNELVTLNTGAQGIGVPFRISECNSFWNGGAPGVSDTYASSLWIIDFLFDLALGGSTGANLHGGGDGGDWTPIADDNGPVVGARPEYYGMLLFTLAGQGQLYPVSLSGIDSLNVTAYAVKTDSGALNLVVNNKDQTQNLKVTAQLPQSANSASLLEMTQLSQGASGPNLTAIEGVTIQGASVNPDGSFSPGAAYTLNPNGSQISFYAPALSAVLVQVSQSP